MAQNALLFIPDISGFTQFVNDNEIAHSQHIIEELLESIIDANDIGLTLSEIEGDAIMFYREGSPPAATELLAQVRRMFINFHAHLRKYETQRICQCGACSSAHRLTLKFFGHYGEVSMNQIKDRSKPFGRNVILIHRMMKNNIPSREYAVFTDELIQANATWVNVEEIAWSAPVSDVESYDVGTVRYSFILLDPLKQHIPAPTASDSSNPGATELLLEEETMIEAPMELVFDVISDLSYRHHWTAGLKNSDMLNHKINQTGATHRCVIGGGSNDPFFVGHDFKTSNDLISFAESDHKSGVTTVRFLHRIEKGFTKVEEKIFIRPNFLKTLIFNLFVKNKFIFGMKTSHTNLNTYCKQLVMESREHPNRIELGFNTPGSNMASSWP